MWFYVVFGKFMADAATRGRRYLNVSGAIFNIIFVPCEVSQR